MFLRPCHIHRITLLLVVSHCHAQFRRHLFDSFSEEADGKHLQQLARVDTALHLTGYIERGQIEEARSRSAVRNLPALPLNISLVESYSGFLTVEKAHNSNLFFWFFPALTGKTDVPVLLWLQGGPGGTSMFALFVENGPFVVTKDLRLLSRTYSWNREFAVLYIDSPVGSGFSYTENDHGYATTQFDVSRDLYEALRQFFTLFHEYRGNAFYLTGESYAGKYIPALAYRIHTMGNKAKAAGINLQGMAIGNGWCDPRNMANYGDFLYQIGLIDQKQRDYFITEENKFVRLVDSEKYVEALELMQQLLNGNDSNKAEGSYFINMTGFDFYYNFLIDSAPADFGYYRKYLTLNQTREAIHVGSTKFDNGDLVFRKLYPDLMRSVKEWIEILLNANYRTLFFSGQLDIVVASTLTDNFLSKLRWKGSDRYYQAGRRAYKLHPKDKSIAGYAKQVDNLYFVIVRNAGHMVPYDQPRVALDLITRFVNGAL